MSNMVCLFSPENYPYHLYQKSQAILQEQTAFHSASPLFRRREVSLEEVLLREQKAPITLLMLAALPQDVRLNQFLLRAFIGKRKENVMLDSNVVLSDHTSERKTSKMEERS